MSDKLTEGLVRELKEAVRRAEVRGILRYFKSRRRTTDYVTVAKALGMFSGGTELASTLGTLQEEDDADGQPLLSSLVVSKQTGIPGKGYFANAREVLEREIAEDDASEREFWADEVEKLGLPRPSLKRIEHLRQAARRLHEDLAPFVEEIHAIGSRAITAKNFDVTGQANKLVELMTAVISACEDIYSPAVAG